MKHKTILVGRTGNALVDPADFEYLLQFTWGRHSQGYAIRSLPSGRGRKIFMHREIINAVKGQRVDHKNGCVLDNRRANLRLCTTTQNSQNKKRAKNNTSGFKGISLEQGLWRARIWVNGKPKHLGSHKTKELAAKAYDRAAEKYFGDFARPNFEN